MNSSKILKNINWLYIKESLIHWEWFFSSFDIKAW